VRRSTGDRICSRRFRNTSARGTEGVVASHTAEYPASSWEAGDQHADIVCSSARKRKRPFCGRDLDEVSCSSGPHLKRVKRSESHSIVADCFLPNADSEVQQMRYKPEPETREGNGVTASVGEGQDSTDYLRAQSCGNSDCDVTKETENSGEVSTSLHHQPGAPSATEQQDGSSEEMNISSGLAGTEAIAETSQEVGSSSGRAATGSGTAGSSGDSGTAGSSGDLDSSSGDAEVSSTSVDADRPEDAATASHQLGSTSSTDEEEGRSDQVSGSYQQSAAATEAAEPSPAASSETVGPVAPLVISDGKCPICLVVFTAEELATPDICGHAFCVGCLEEWSANSNTCPLDRHEFSAILVRRYPDGEILRRIPLTPRTEEIEHDIILPHIIICSFCGQAPGQGRMLFCLGCAHFYHAECLDSVMDTIPNEERFCPFCVIISLVTTNSG
jgi:hypothetical protein